MAEETYFDKISAQIKTGNEPYTWYRNRIKELGTPTVPELLRSGKLNKTPHPKHLNMFVYAPKFAKKLPYYDTFPLVMYLKPAEGGFYGLNFHYLPYALRARLLDAAGQDKLSVSAVENSRLTNQQLKDTCLDIQGLCLEELIVKIILLQLCYQYKDLRKHQIQKSGATLGR